MTTQLVLEKVGKMLTSSKTIRNVFNAQVSLCKSQLNLKGHVTYVTVSTQVFHIFNKFKYVKVIVDI